MTDAGKCVYCSAPINPERDYQGEKGWIKRRTQGGTNAVRGMRLVDAWACSTCVDKVAKGISPRQDSLL